MSNLPDTKLAVTTGLAAALTGVTVCGRVPDLLASSTPLVAVYRPTSPPAMHHARWDRAAINVQAWGSTEQEARDTAADAYDAVHALAGTMVASVVISEVSDVTGIGELPDPAQPDLYRYVFSVAVTARNA